MSEKEIMTADEFAVKHGYKSADEMPDCDWCDWAMFNSGWDVFIGGSDIEECVPVIRKAYKEKKKLYMRVGIYTDGPLGGFREGEREYFFDHHYI